jgi:hypothetical protein
MSIQERDFISFASFSMHQEEAGGVDDMPDQRRTEMGKTIRLAVLLVMVTTMLSGCIVPPWWDGYGGHHNGWRHDRW